MRTQNAVWLLSLGLLCSGAMDQVLAADKPDTLMLLKQHPEFVTLTKLTDVVRGSAKVRVMFCRRKGGNCEMFESEAKDVTSLTDYAYLFAVYKGQYRSTQAAKASAAHAADALLDEAKEKGYGQVLLDSYATQYPCDKIKDVTACVLHALWKNTSIRRFEYEPDGTGFHIVFAEEDGSTTFGD